MDGGEVEGVEGDVNPGQASTEAAAENQAENAAAPDDNEQKQGIETVV